MIVHMGKEKKSSGGLHPTLVGLRPQHPPRDTGTATYHIGMLAIFSV